MIENLDIQCAILGEKLGKSVDETFLTNSLSVLEEQGVYALFLYLDSRRKEWATGIKQECMHFLRTTPKTSPLISRGDGKSNDYNELKVLSQDIDKLLLGRDLLRQGLVYARYHAKARSSERSRG